MCACSSYKSVTHSQSTFGLEVLLNWKDVDGSAGHPSLLQHICFFKALPNSLKLPSPTPKPTHVPLPTKRAPKNIKAGCNAGTHHVHDTAPVMRFLEVLAFFCRGPFPRGGAFWGCQKPWKSCFVAYVAPLVSAPSWKTWWWTVYMGIWVLQPLGGSAQPIKSLGISSVASRRTVSLGTGWTVTVCWCCGCRQLTQSTSTIYCCTALGCLLAACRGLNKALLLWSGFLTVALNDAQ